ncbi:MAG TPA: aminotransferase class V-fold PLP-dependent enzyme [Pyrinomonadaceae bacterium]|nr:aminotransferase class V-fold PLP-dependent enzyme [Pyrinomonadaceae bacterium]
MIQRDPDIKNRIYLDNNATTRVAPEVVEAMEPFLNTFFGNPSSAHSRGREMKGAVEQAREQVAELLGAAEMSEVVFTSCGSESDNWAIRGVLENNPDKKHIITTRVEHEAVRNLCLRLEAQGYEVTWLGVNGDGELDLAELREALRPHTALVSVMLANNETGVLFPVEEIAKLVHENSEALFHVDGVQAVGKIPIDLKALEVDLFALSGHKFHAPQGIGALYIKSGVQPAPLMIGGGQEAGRRAGTSAVPNIVGLGAACALAGNFQGHERLERLRNKLESEILRTIPNSLLNGTNHCEKRLPNTANISFENARGDRIMTLLDERGICVSTGSACHSTTQLSSPTLSAMNVPANVAEGSIRFSLGRYNTEAEIDYTLEVLPEIIGQSMET